MTRTHASVDGTYAGRPTKPITFDYEAPAEVYLAHSKARRKGKLSYHRFPTAQEAIRFAINEQPGPLLRGTIMSVFEKRFDHSAIRHLYDAMDDL